MPWDWLNDEEVSPEELDYREMIRNSVMSGEVPLDPEAPAALPGQPENLVGPPAPSIQYNEGAALDPTQVEDARYVKRQEETIDTEPIPVAKLPQEPPDDPEWTAFEETMDKSYAGMSDEEIDQAFRVQAQKEERGLNKASTLIADRELETDIIGSGKPTPFTAGKNLTDAKGGFFGTKTGPIEAWNMISQGLQDITAVPGVTDFIQDEVNPAAADFLTERLKDPTGLKNYLDVVVNRVGLSKQYEAATDIVPFQSEYGKFAEAGGQMGADLIPSTGIDLAVALAPGVGELRGAFVGAQGAMTAGASSAFTRLAMAETIGSKVGPQVAKSLTTAGVRAAADDVGRFVGESVLLNMDKKALNTVRGVIKKALPNLTTTEIDTLIVNERVKGIEMAHQVDEILRADAGDLVTVYHATDAQSAESIRRTGFRKDSFVTTDPEAARMHSIEKRGIENPEVIEFRVPRAALRQSKANPIVFQNLEAWGEPNIRDQVTQIMTQVRDFLKNPDFSLASERGSFQLPGKVPEQRGPGAGIPGQWNDVWGWVDPEGNFNGLNGHNHNIIGDVDELKSQGWIRTNGSNARGNKSVNVEFKPWKAPDAAEGNDRGVRTFLNKNIDLRDPNTRILIRNEATGEQWSGTGLEWRAQGRPVPGIDGTPALDMKGLPPGVKTQGDLDDLLKRVTAKAVSGAGSRFWYDSSAAAIKQLAQGDMEAADKMARIIAWTSTNTSVSGQGAMALRGFAQHMRGESTAGIHVKKVTDKLDEILQYNDDQMVDLVKHLVESTDASRAKLGNFYTDIIDGIKPELAARIRAETGTSATIDRWMNRAFGFGENRTPAQYKFMSDQTVAIAKELGWTPKQVQAAIWVAQKAEDEGVSVLNNFDYRDSLRRHLGQISWESMPGTGSNRAALLAGMEDAPMELKAEMHLRIAQALQDDDGTDILARTLKLPVEGTFEAPGAFMGKVSPGSQTKTYIGTASGASKLPTPALDATQRAAASDYAAALGYVLEQNAMAWTRPLIDAPAWRHNAMDIDIGRILDPEEMAALSQALGDDFALVASEQGTWAFRIPDDADFTLTPATGAKEEGAIIAGAKNKAAQQKIQEAIHSVFAGDQSVKIKTFATDGDYIESKVPNGEDYLSGRSALERPEVRQVLDELKSRVNAVDQEFAQRLQPADTPTDWWSANRRADAGADAAADRVAFGGNELEEATRASMGNRYMKIPDPGQAPQPIDKQLASSGLTASRLSDDSLRSAYTDARMEAGLSQDKLDELMASGADEKEIFKAREDVYYGLRNVQRYGEELANRTQGQEGTPAKIVSALKKMLGDETGSVYIWGVGPVKPSHPLGTPIPGTTKLARMQEEARVAAEAIVPKAFNLGTERPGLARRLAGKLAPGFQIPREVMVANEARRYVEAQVPSFVNPLARAAKGITETWAKAPPVWKGEWDDATASFIVPPNPPKHVNTALDFLERPWNYDNVSPELATAQQGWDEAFDGLLVRLNDEYGIQIEPFYGYEPNLQKIPTAPRRGSYVPHRDSEEYLQRMEKEGLTGASSNSKSTAKEMLEKERHIPTINERMKLTPEFEPELDLNTIAVKYGAEAARAAGKKTQADIIGGKTVSELMEELHPQLATMRKAQAARVQNTRQQIISLRNALKLAGYGEKKLDGQLTIIARREAVAAGKVEKVEEGFEHIADLKAEAKVLQREAKAYQKLVDRITGASKSVDDKLDQTAKLRDKLTKLQQTAIDKLGDYDQKITDAAAGADDAKLVNLRTQRNIAALEGRIKGLQAFDESLGAIEEGAAERLVILQNKLTELKKASIAVTMNDLTDLNRRIRQAETASMADAMQAMGAQRELRSMGKNAQNQLKVAMKRVADLGTTLEAKQAELERQIALQGKLRDAYSLTKDGVTKNYKLDPVTKKYVHPRVAAAQQALANIGDDSNILNLLEEGRAVQLSTGDLSPIMYGRAQMGAFGYLGTLANQLSPVQKDAMGKAHIAVPKLIAKGLAQGDAVWDGVNPEYLRVFQGVRGRAVTMPTNDIRANDKLRGAERILTGERGSKVPVVGNMGIGLRRMNDAMTRMATFAEFSAWETSVRAELRANPHQTLVEAGEGVYKGMRNIAPQVDFIRLGYSPAQSRVLNAGFTSLSYMAATPQFAVAYPKSLAKLGVKLFTEGLNPKDAWRALGVADRETIVHGSEILGTLSALAGASAALFGDEDVPLDERVLDAVNPLGQNGWTLQLGGGSKIPLAVPLRAGIRTTAATLQGLGAPVDAIPGAKVRGDALAPVNYVGNRLISAPSMIYHLAKNEDWQGREIVNGDKDFKGKLTDAVMYGMESLSIVTAPTIHALRTGEMGNAGSPATPLGVVKETLESQGGLNIYDPSRTTQYRALQTSIMEELIQDGTIPPDKAQLFKDMEYSELPSSLRKLVDNTIEEKHADAKDWYERGRRLDNNPFQLVADESDKARAQYAKEFDILQQKLFNGEDPKMVWEAYEIKKAELRGAMNNIYNNNKAYNEAVAGLEIGDMRRIEDGWYAITEAAYAKNAGAMSDKDYQDLATKKAEYIEKLIREVPDKAELFVYSLKVQEENALDEAHPLEVMRKQARAELAPYYAIPEDDKEGREEFLRLNPSADVARWLTSASSSPAVNSIAALEQAYSIIPKRGVHLSGSDQIVTDENLPIYREYAKEIERMFSLPSTQRHPNDPSRTFNPRTELRKQSALYDAVWFWLGMVTPDDKNTVPVYHPQEVLQYIRMWGPRADKANIRSY